MELEDFLAGEQSQGQRVSEDSAFTLNPEQVRSRVATFCSEIRLYPLLRCLQGILRVCQGDLFFRYEANTWWASFAWPDCPSAEQFRAFILDGVSEGFDAVPHGVNQHFFFGLSAALGAEGYRLEWRSPRGGYVASGGRLEVTEACEQTNCQLGFSMDAHWWERLTGRSDLKSVVAQELEHRLCYSPVPVFVEGEQLKARVPSPPDRPWGASLAQGSNLAWRYLRAASDQTSFRPPEVCLDRYRGAKRGTIWHLIKEDPAQPLPLSVQFSDPRPANASLPSPFASRTQDHGNAPLCQAALFLSLQAGRKDWLFPVRDGLLTEPVPISISRGGVLVVAADADLRFDLSGLKVVEDDRLEAKRRLWMVEAKEMRKRLGVSLANISVRAEHLPSQYDQASGYVLGGPYAGLLGGKVGPMLRKLFRRGSR